MRNTIKKKFGFDKIPNFLVRFIKHFYHYSGIEFIFRKFIPSSTSSSLPTGFIWLIGIYVAFYGIALQRYQNRVDIIEGRVTTLLTLMGTSAAKAAVETIPVLQKMACPLEPEITNPFKTLFSFFGESKIHYETSERLKSIITSLKDNLNGINLSGVDLSGANLENGYFGDANFSDANLSNVNFSGAYLRGTIFKNSDFTNAKLVGADLSETELRNALFINADLRNANLKGAFLDSANFQDCDLRNAILREVHFTSFGTLAQAKTLYGAKLDEHVERIIRSEYPDLLKEHSE